MRVLIVFCAISVANGFGSVAGGQGGPHPNNHPHQHKPPHRPLPRYYNDLPPHIIASPRPMHPAYRTLNPGPTHPSHHINPNRQSRSEQKSPHPLSQNPQQPVTLLASASTTPVLVLKKDHTRPALSSAVLASLDKPQQQKPQEPQKQIPTVIMERPPPPTPQQQQQQHHHQQQHPSQPEEKPEKPVNLPPKPLPSRSHETSLEQDELSEESAPQIPPTASAERRMFFDSVTQNGAHAHEMMGPQGSSNPHKQPQRVASASNMQQTRAHSQPRPPQPSHADDDDEEDNLERITRSNNNPYGGNFQYPPPQGNYISQGPTRVPVKYQQGVVGLKPREHPGQGHPGGQSHHGGQSHPGGQVHHGGQGHPGGQGGRPRPYKQRVQNANSEEPLSEELEEEEEAQPDRLQELLGTSKFVCSGKKDGYYADDTLNCEVFHYCQDGGKHSWLCPDGFAFHQIHLICVPPSSDNICKQSSNFHFVNEYLYRPINEKETEGTNISLKYADRYFPDGYNHGAGDVILPYNNDDEEEDRPVRHQQQQQPAHNPYASQRLRPQQPSQQYPQYTPQQQQHHPRHPSQSPFLPSPQVPQPRPQQHHQSHRQQQQQQQQQQSLHAYAQQRSGSAPHPQAILPQKPVPQHKPSKSSQSNPGVFYSPESINIPLNQRRPIPNPHPSHHPQIFRPSLQVNKQLHHAQPPKESSRRKYEDEDEYEY